MLNTWETIEKTFSGLSYTKTSIAHYATKMTETCTWPHLLSTCKHPYLKGLRIACHNKVIHLINQTIQANKHTRYYTLTNATNLNNNNQENTVPNWLINCTCTQTICQCHTKLRPDILCILGPQTTHLHPLHPHTHTQYNS